MGLLLNPLAAASSSPPPSSFIFSSLLPYPETQKALQSPRMSGKVEMASSSIPFVLKQHELPSASTVST